MPSSKLWETPLPIGTPVIASPAGTSFAGTSFAGTVASWRKGDLTPYIYLVETTKLDENGYREAHWIGMTNVRPVDKSNPAELTEWLDAS